jgi:hypothetical protein
MSRFVLTRPGTCRICQRRLEAGTMVSWERGKGVWCMDHDAPAPSPASTNHDSDKLYLALDTIMSQLDTIQSLLKEISGKLEVRHEAEGQSSRTAETNQPPAKSAGAPRRKVAPGND